ncbi:anaerobic sulfatase maturase [Shewanella sp. CG12_big_fil_rev_8_21_14_0_65_47_15]|uniref:anaerobic sulfatase maturase n=1 Tax=Shewanella sp. CG12_big_fil_rev_8_21_14_0_65_47_15 TaxID=1975537 RepID=UPI000CBD6123|nr:anaerobic sulfatase maturase [Shewanella sp. CG12_big_fil_rev_8_21_14_0_65_47_15]PIW62518.1 MAG: anaerobic sulfatase maturase [Shewanella sp. CG12_big_fil_rev_8_21_14_0_65_47_15]
MSQSKQDIQKLGLHLMAKPVGPICNLECHYCFYLEKRELYPERQHFSMSDEVLRAYIEQNIRHEPSLEVLFTWQGGEPMLRGLNFYRRAYAWQQELAGAKTIRNSIQTNGVLLDEEWCEFLAEAGFMVGISLDGPQAIHDRDRVDKKERPTFDAVMKGLELLKRFKIEFNVLVTVTSSVAEQPLAVYQFLKQQGVTHIQFNPVVERIPSNDDLALGLTFATPPKLDENNLLRPTLMMTPHSVSPHAYGQFLIAIFDEWIRQDVGTIYVMNFEWALASWLQLPSTICLFAKNCGNALIVEHNGDVYSCDHFMYPDYLLGNLQQSTPQQMADSQQQRAFGQAKSTTLPDECRQCDYLFACHGECPKNRFVIARDGKPGLNYLCPSYKSYFQHLTPYLNAMAKLVSHNLPASMVMDALNGPLVIPLSDREVS